MKKFSGELSAWMTFIDLFGATVDRSTNLSDVKKFNYYHIWKKTLCTLYQGSRHNKCKLQEGSRVAEESIRESIENHIGTYE